MTVWGINALNHGSSISVFEKDQLIYFKSDSSDHLSQETIDHARSLGSPEEIFWYERPWIKKLRQLKAGQWSAALDMTVIPKNYLKTVGLGSVKLCYTPHHASHAAAGYYTSPFDQAAVVVLDAIGEFECATIWKAQDEKLVKVWHRSYPNSLGLFYSAFTKLIGHRPIFEEHLLQKSSDLGDSERYYDQVRKYFNGTICLRENLHRGVWDWTIDLSDQQDRYDLAAAVQRVFEDQVDSVMETAKNLTGQDNLVYMGGCAMNSRYNQRLVDRWQRTWSLPNPGDPSSSLGAVLYHTQTKVHVDIGVVKHLEIRV